MMLRKAIAAVIAAGALAASASAFAGNVNPQGFYVDGNIGWGHVDGDAPSGVESNEGGFAWSANLGYQFTENLALEAGYLSFADADYKIAGSNVARFRKNYAYDLAVKGILPFDNGMSVYAKLGAARTHTEVETLGVNLGSARDTTFLYGGGVSYALDQNFALQAQFVGNTSTSNANAMYQVTGGVAYHF